MMRQRQTIVAELRFTSFRSVERPSRQRVIKHPKVRRRSEQLPQPIRTQQRRLHPQTSPLTRDVVGIHLVAIVVGQAPVRLGEAVFPLHQRVTQLVQDHLRQAVVVIQILLRSQKQVAFSVGVRVAVRRASHRESQLVSRRDPDVIERVDVFRRRRTACHGGNFPFRGQRG